MNKSELTIGIVTHKARKDLVKNLIHNIRNFSGNEMDIVLSINGDNEQLMDPEYRNEMLDFCRSVPNCFPIFCPEFKSLPKLWNTNVIFSRTEYVLLLGDDLSYPTDAVAHLLAIIEQSKCQFFTINGGYSHFVITKKMLHTLGYFDERLLAFGEEDGDILHRYIEIFKSPVPNVMMPGGPFNLAKYDVKPINSEIHVDNKPTINKIVREAKYTSDPNGIVGMWGTPLRKVWQDFQQYPYEMFVRKNRHNMKKFDKLDVSYD